MQRARHDLTHPLSSLPTGSGTATTAPSPRLAGVGWALRPSRQIPQRHALALAAAHAARAARLRLRGAGCVPKTTTAPMTQDIAVQQAAWPSVRVVDARALALVDPLQHAAGRASTAHTPTLSAPRDRPLPFFAVLDTTGNPSQNADKRLTVYASHTLRARAGSTLAPSRFDSRRPCVRGGAQRAALCMLCSPCPRGRLLMTIDPMPRIYPLTHQQHMTHAAFFAGDGVSMLALSPRGGLVLGACDAVKGPWLRGACADAKGLMSSQATSKGPEYPPELHVSTRRLAGVAAGVCLLTAPRTLTGFTSTLTHSSFRALGDVGIACCIPACSYQSIAAKPVVAQPAATQPPAATACCYPACCPQPNAYIEHAAPSLLPTACSPQPTAPACCTPACSTPAYSATASSTPACSTPDCYPQPAAPRLQTLNLYNFLNSYPNALKLGLPASP